MKNLTRRKFMRGGIFASIGWYKESEPKMYNSKGIGTSLLPIRFGARAEMVVMKI